MTVQESYQIVYMIHTAYPSDSKATAQELAERVNLFAAFFADYPAETVRTAARGWIANNKWMPTPHDIKEACDMLLRLVKNLANAKIISFDTLDDDSDDLSYLFEEDKPSECCYKCSKLKDCYPG